jgi:hypothetical protein
VILVILRTIFLLHFYTKSPLFLDWRTHIFLLFKAIFFYFMLFNDAPKIWENKGG